MSFLVDLVTCSAVVATFVFRAHFSVSRRDVAGGESAPGSPHRAARGCAWGKQQRLSHGVAGGTRRPHDEIQGVLACVYSFVSVCAHIRLCVCVRASCDLDV